MAEKPNCEGCSHCRHRYCSIMNRDAIHCELFDKKMDKSDVCSKWEAKQ